MLTLMRTDGVPVVCRAAYFRDLMDDLEAYGNPVRSTGPDIITRWALVDDTTACCETMHFFSCIVLQSYRVMVGAFSWGYHPDWLCALPSKALGHPQLPAWDRFGKRIV